MSAKTGRNKPPARPGATASGGGEASPSAQTAEASELPALACRAVEIFVRERRVVAPTPGNSSSLLNERLACLVSIKTTEKKLRGFIGTVEPEKESLAEEIIANA